MKECVAKDSGGPCAATITPRVAPVLRLAGAAALSTQISVAGPLAFVASVAAPHSCSCVGDKGLLQACSWISAAKLAAGEDERSG